MALGVITKLFIKIPRKEQEESKPQPLAARNEKLDNLKLAGPACDSFPVELVERYFMFSYLEVKDDGPDETEGEFGVAVDNVFAPDVDKFDLFVTEES